MPPQNQPMGYAAADLGLGGMLQDQVSGETEEQRKKRMLQMQQRQMMGPAGTPATQMLFGSGLGSGGLGAGYR